MGEHDWAHRCKFRPWFNACYDDDKERHGQPFRVIEVIDENNNPEDIDWECLPQFKIVFLDDGEESWAYPEEVVEQSFMGGLGGMQWEDEYDWDQHVHRGFPDEDDEDEWFEVEPVFDDN